MWRECSAVLKINAWTAAVNTVSCVVAAVALWFVYSQLAAMRGQLDLMKADSNSTSAAMSEQLSTMKEQALAMYGQLEQMKTASRAWVALADGKITGGMDGKSNVTAELSFVNSGDTPANAVKIAKALVIDKPGCDIETRAKLCHAEAMGSITSETHRATVYDNRPNILRQGYIQH